MRSEYLRRTPYIIIGYLAYLRVVLAARDMSLSTSFLNFGDGEVDFFAFTRSEILRY